MIDHALVQPLEQGDAGVERGLEIELAAHRLLGHRGDLGLEAGIIGELVDAFDRDHRRIHVGDEQLPAPALARLDDHVDAGDQAFERLRGRREGRRRAAMSQALPSSTHAWPRDPPSASSAAEISPRVSRSAAISVAMNKTDPSKPPLALIAGPTASGKSSLALALAEASGGVVINADSAQVYRDLAIVSARPSAADEARAPHRLYGYRDGADACSAADWAADAKAAIAEAHAAGRLPILVGGTGLYIRTLIEGIAPVPEIDPAVRKAVRALSVGEAHAALVRRRIARRRSGSGRATPPASRARSRWSDRPAGRLKAWQAEKHGGIGDAVRSRP